MGQITLYIPEELEVTVKREAKKAKISLSAYVVELLRRRLKPKKWSPQFLKICGSWEGDFPERQQIADSLRKKME